MNNNNINTYSSSNRDWTLHHGDVQNVLPTLSPNSHSGALSDPPYGINLMNHGWDRTVPPVSVWEQVLRLCKPGAFLLAFGGTKTFHRLIVNIEDAGWEIRDTCLWLYGEGFPKGQDIGKAVSKRISREQQGVGQPNDANLWTGYNTALKPAWEPIVLAQKPRQETYANNALRFGCGGLNIDECRTGPGRFPANLLLDEDAAEILDRQSASSQSRPSRRRSGGTNVGNGKTLSTFRSRHEVVEGYSDEGGLSRFFYVAKARGKERLDTNHPTLKPLNLCEQLAKLIRPPSGYSHRRLLVPFSGAGSEMIGGLAAGWDHVTGIERDEQYVADARKRLSNRRCIKPPERS